MAKLRKVDKKLFSSKEIDEEEDWQVICEQSLFANRLHQLEEICLEEHRGNSTDFIANYLRPVVELLDTIRSKCEDYYELNSQRESPTWTERFENIVKYAIHPGCLKTTLVKGDFYIHVSSVGPRVLELRYLRKGQLYSRSLSMSDTILMCSKNWTELLRSEVQETDIYRSCILWTKKGFERATWIGVLTGDISGKMETEFLQTSDEVETTFISRDLNDSVAINPEEFSVKPVLILDLNFELLHSQVAYLPGSRDKRGGPVIFFETNKTIWENADMNSEELTKLLVYYYKIVRESSRNLGCSLVIDARGAKQTRDILECIGESIQLFQKQIPGSVHMAHVLTRRDSLMLLFKTSKIKESLNFQFQFLSSTEKLVREVRIDQLPESYGGHLTYDHEKWIKFRTKIEPFMTGCRSAAKRAMNYIQQLSRNDLGNTLEECENLLEEHRTKMNEVLEDDRLHGLRTEGKSILDRLDNEEHEGCNVTDDYKHTIECLHRLYNQMTRVFDRLQLIAERRMKHLEITYKLKKFDESNTKVLSWFREEGLPFLEREKDIGDSVETSRNLLNKFEEFKLQSDGEIASGEENLSLANVLIETSAITIDRKILIEKRDELQKILNDYSIKFTARSKILTKCLEFHQLLIEGSNRWMSGLQYIAHMNMEDIQTQEGITRLRISLDEFMESNPKCEESQIARLTELAHHLGSKYVESAEQVNSKCLEVEAMLQAKKNQIFGAEARLKKLKSNSVIYSDGDEQSSGFRDDDLSTEPDDTEYYDHSVEDCSEPINSPAEDHVNAVFGWGDTEQPYDENDSKLAVFDAAMSPKMKERLQHIIAEMISTEAEYVNSIEYVLINYIPDMHADSVPANLKGKKNVLFGNIERIYDFHKRFFSQEVLTYRHAPLQIGKCFLKWERRFYLYALYNKNKPKSDQLWDDFANVFFKNKLKELNDKLDLASYLIKPVQRLGKYALLLRDMISCCDPKDPRVVEMTTAHELMKFQLRHGNDLLAMDAIRQADVNLKEQGCLLRQGDFIVWYGKRKRLRRVFLFEHLLVFTKSKKEKARGDAFTYKHSIKMADLGLTENIGDTGLKFEVWYRRWKKRRASETYVLQASTEEVKLSWTTDITRILWRQATRNKEYELTEATTGISVESTPSAVFYDPSAGNSFVRSPRSDFVNKQQAATNNKRLSWLSAGESSGSSGVHDLGSLPEDNHAVSPRNLDDVRLHFVRDGDVKYASLPRKKLSHQNSAPIRKNQISMATSSVSLRQNFSVGGYDGSFIRNNVYRKTLQVESSTTGAVPIRPPRKKGNRRSGSSPGRYATQPIILPSNFVPESINIINNLKTLANSRPTSPDQNQPIRGSVQCFYSPPALRREHLPKSLTDTEIYLRRNIDNNDKVKRRTCSTRSEPGGRILSPVLRKSLTDYHLDIGERRSSEGNHSSSAAKDAFKRRSSFNKAMGFHNISVDGRKIKRHTRNQSSIGSSESFGVKSPNLSERELSPKCSTPTMNRSERKNPLFTLRAKLSKSLSEF